MSLSARRNLNRSLGGVQANTAQFRMRQPVYRRRQRYSPTYAWSGCRVIAGGKGYPSAFCFPPLCAKFLWDCALDGAGTVRHDASQGMIAKGIQPAGRHLGDNASLEINRSIVAELWQLLVLRQSRGSSNSVRETVTFALFYRIRNSVDASQAGGSCSTGGLEVASSNLVAPTGS